MGTCGSRPETITLDTLKGLSIGQRYQFGSGCGPQIDGTQGGSAYDRLSQRGMSWPNNGEFEWGGRGDSCSMCSDPTNGYGCDGCSGASAITGNRGTVKRTAYKGDPTGCCTLQPSSGTYNGNTCDPQYKASNFSNGACNNAMQTYCSQGSNIVNDANCVQWANVVGDGNSYVSSAMKTFCGTGSNITGTVCGSWRDKNLTAEQSWYDAQVSKYCKANPSDKTFCGCYNLGSVWTESPLSAGAIKPSCYVPECANGTSAYRSATMIADAKTCAPIAICNQRLTANMTNAEVAALNQTCNILQTTSTTNNTVPGEAAKATATTTPTATSAASSSTTSSKTLAIIVGVIIALIILCMCSGGMYYALEK